MTNWFCKPLLSFEREREREREREKRERRKWRKRGLILWRQRLASLNCCLKARHETDSFEPAERSETTKIWALGLAWRCRRRIEPRFLHFLLFSSLLFHTCQPSRSRRDSPDLRPKPDVPPDDPKKPIRPDLSRSTPKNTMLNLPFACSLRSSVEILVFPVSFSLFSCTRPWCSYPNKKSVYLR